MSSKDKNTPLDDIAISVRNLSKCYQIYDQPHDRLKQSIYPRVQKFVGKPPKQYFNEFWALRDVSFQVKKGETVGIIGRNGSGKSTLLQMICGTLNSTGGTIETRGRVAALLELGSGFNPEFTGRENVYMNASVLGLSREEIGARFDDIVAFADIGEFIEQPVKTYSSGMMLRLAFAVIAHVDADILIVDEALSVGDAIFAQKCMRFVRKFQEQGTLLLVSHDENAIKNFCQKALWLSNGFLQLFSQAEEACNAYMKYCLGQSYDDSLGLESLNSENKKKKGSEKQEEQTSVYFFENIANSSGWTTGHAQIISVEILSPKGQLLQVFEGGEKIRIRICASIGEPLVSPIIGFFVKDRLGQPLFGEHTYDYGRPAVFQSGEKLEANFVFQLPLLPNGDYSMTVSVADGNPHDHIQHHWLHDVVLMHVHSQKLRYGLVGILFESVAINKIS